MTAGTGSPVLQPGWVLLQVREACTGETHQGLGCVIGWRLAVAQPGHARLNPLLGLEAL